MSALSRFERLAYPEPMSGCWLWMGAVNKDGYGTFKIGFRRSEGAHRRAWKLFRGRIPAGRWVLHSCDIACCVNPDHLFLGDARANALDRERKRRGRWSKYW